VGAHRVTSKSDIVEDLCSADPEENPSAAKIIMPRAAAEIECLRNRVQQTRELLKMSLDYLDRSDESGATLLAKDIRKELAKP
jgi:hypothetical protein